MGRLMWIQWAEMLHLQGSQEGSAEKEAFPIRKMAFQEESSIDRVLRGLKSFKETRVWWEHEQRN